MIQKVMLATIHCTDQQAARDFYVDVLGLHVRADVTNEGTRWLLVGPPDQPELSLMLVPADPLMKAVLDAGDFSTVTFAVDDCRATINELRSKDVEIVHDASDHSLGLEAIVRDNSGNTLVFIEYRQ